MSPLVTTLFIMLLTVVYNESQLISDYPDDYPKILTKNAFPLDLCNLPSNKKLCRKSKELRELLKDTNYIRDDAKDFSREYAHDYFVDDDINSRNVKIGKKRNLHKIIGYDDCATVKSHKDLGEGYYPRIIGNVTCKQEHTSSESQQQTCSGEWGCRPVKQFVRVLSRHTLRYNVPNDVPQELRGCWLFEDIPIHAGCKCERF